MSPSTDRLLNLVRAIREEAAVTSTEQPSTETLISYLRGELGSRERLRIQDLLARSEDLRAQLLELSELEGEEALERYDAVADPVAPTLRLLVKRRRVPRWRRWAPAAAVAILLLAVLPLLRSSDPVRVAESDWVELSRMHTEQFESRGLRGEGPARPSTMPTSRLALVAALLGAVEWQPGQGWRARTAPPEVTLIRNGTAFDLAEPLTSPVDGIGFFDLRTRVLWSYPVQDGAEAPTRFAFPGQAAGEWLLLRWWQEDAQYRAAIVAGHL